MCQHSRGQWCPIERVPAPARYSALVLLRDGKPVVNWLAIAILVGLSIIFIPVFSLVLRSFTLPVVPLAWQALLNLILYRRGDGIAFMPRLKRPFFSRGSMGDSRQGP